MKTYNLTVQHVAEATGPNGAWCKTADHFEAVAELQDQLKAERAKSAALLLRFETTLTQLSSVMENARKGVEQQSPLGPQWCVITGPSKCAEVSHALQMRVPFKHDGYLWQVLEYRPIRTTFEPRVNALLRRLVTA